MRAIASCLLCLFAGVTTAAGQAENESDAIQSIENEFEMTFLPVPFQADGDATVDVIYLQETELTFEQYRQVMVASGKKIDPYMLEPSDQPLMPKDFDDWEDAKAFAELLSAIDEEYSYRLPNEAEWEFACLGGAEAVEPVKRNSSDDSYWFVRQHEPNAYGLHDMLGVLGEYCADGYQSETYPESMRFDIAEGPNAKVVRGMRQSCQPTGCFQYEFDYRFPIAPSGQESTLIVGLRLVVEAK